MTSEHFKTNKLKKWFAISFSIVFVSKVFGLVVGFLGQKFCNKAISIILIPMLCGSLFNILYSQYKMLGEEKKEI